MRKGVVIRISKGTALIMENNGRFRRIRAQKNWVVGDTVSVAALPRRHGVKFWTVQVACLVLMALVIQFGVYHYCGVPATYISIDVNPSIEIAVSRFDKVISVTAYNEDGGDVLEGLQLEGMDYINALLLLLESEGMKPYMEDEPSVMFAVSSEDGREGELVNSLNDMAHELGYLGQDTKYLCGSVDWELTEKAHELGLSVGRMAMYVYMEENGEEELTAEELLSRSVASLIDLVNNG